MGCSREWWLESGGYLMPGWVEMLGWVVLESGRCYDGNSKADLGF